MSLEAEGKLSITDLPAHVLLRILSLLSAKDLCRLQTCCRAFQDETCSVGGLSISEAAAAEVISIRAPGMQPKLGESWKTLLRFVEQRALRPTLSAAEDSTTMVGADGLLYVWGPVLAAPGAGTPSCLCSNTVSNFVAKAQGACFEVLNSPDNPRVVSSTAGHAFSAALDPEGAIIIWRNSLEPNGILGSGDDHPPELRSAISQVNSKAGKGKGYGGVDSLLGRLLNPPPLRSFEGERVVQLALGRLHAVALTHECSVFTWGADNKGQLGHGAVKESLALARMALGGSPVIRSPWSGGRRRGSRSRSFGGGGGPTPSSPPTSESPDPSTPEDSVQGSSSAPLHPQRVLTLEGEGVCFVAAAGFTSMALNMDGEVFAWGDNTHGQLGLGDELARDVPERVESLSQSGLRAVTWASDQQQNFHAPNGVAALSLGLCHALAVTTRGDLFAWGSNSHGQLGQGGSHPLPSPWPSPVNELAKIGTSVVCAAAGGEHSVCVDDLGQVWAWGAGSAGQCGGGRHGVGLWYSEPHVVKGISSRVVNVAAGRAHTAAVTENGEVYTWGCNVLGSLGPVLGLTHDIAAEDEGNLVFPKMIDRPHRVFY